MSQSSVTSASSDQSTRRAFLQSAATAAAAVTLGTRAATGKLVGANDRIGLGLIGCGGEGNALMGLVNACKAAGERVEIVAVCDIYRPRLEKAAERYKAKSYDNHKDLLADSSVDAVVIATPDHIHGQQVIDAVRAGKDVYCEKPVTHWRQFELTKQLATEVKKSKQVFELGSQYMSDSAWSQARKLVQGGLIGRPVHAEVGFFRTGDWGERGMPIDDPDAKPGPDLNWEAFLGDSPKRPFDVSRFFRWRMYWDYAGGPATDLYPHCLSQVISLLGLRMPSMVSASGGKFRYEEREVPDTFSLLIDYPEKVSITMVGTQASSYPGGPVRPPCRSPVIRGWDGTLTFEGEEIIFTPNDGSKKEAKRFRIEHPFSHQAHMQKYLTCCRTREQTDYGADLAYWVQTPLQMGILSLREGKVARFDPAAEKIVL